MYQSLCFFKKKIQSKYSFTLFCIIYEIIQYHDFQRIFLNFNYGAILILFTSQNNDNQCLQYVWHNVGCVRVMMILACPESCQTYIKRFENLIQLSEFHAFTQSTRTVRSKFDALYFIKSIILTTMHATVILILSQRIFVRKK